MRLAKVLDSAFALAALSAGMAVVAGSHFFPSVRDMASSALLALALSSLTQRQLEENRVAIWEQTANPYTANLQLASYFVRVFVAIFAVSFIFETTSIFAGPRSSIGAARFRNAFIPLLAHNGGVLLAGFALSLVYGAGGLTLVLAWNALQWSQNLVPVILFSEGDLISRGLIATALLPHLIFEALGYVLGGMAGTFLGKACIKYQLLSLEFYRVTKACLLILLLSIVSVSLAAAFEVSLAGQVSRLF